MAPNRRLNGPPKIAVDRLSGSLTHFGNVISATISLDPPQFSNMPLRSFDECPICGLSTEESLRRAANLHPVFENGIRNISFGCWVHEECFENCPDTGALAPVLW